MSVLALTGVVTPALPLFHLGGIETVGLANLVST
jgi:hypothetical protein